ncbi:hypothetical protein Tco_0432511 [Tanacetum coccineum]
MLAPPVVEGEGSVIHLNDEERIEQDDLMDFVPPTPYDSPLSGGHTPGSDEGRPNINELMAICTNLLNRVLALEQSKTAQDLVIKKLKNRKSLDEEYVSKQGRKSDKTKPMFDDSDFAELDVDNAMENVEVNTASIDVSAAGPSNVSTASSFYKSTRPITTSVVIRDVEEEPRRATPVPTVQSQDKGKGKMVEPEPTPKKLNGGRCSISCNTSIKRKRAVFIDEQVRLLVEADSEMSRELLRKIFYQANRPRQMNIKFKGRIVGEIKASQVSTLLLVE